MIVHSLQTNGTLLVNSDESLRHGDDGAPADVGGQHGFIGWILNAPQETRARSCIQVPNVCIGVGAAADEHVGFLLIGPTN